MPQMHSPTATAVRQTAIVDSSFPIVKSAYFSCFKKQKSH